MPQNKPMKIQWITVNGRQVPLVLPQTYSYADDDWKVTSDRDPLPVVEYGTTAGGIVVPKRVSDEGHELTQLTGSYVKEIVIVKGLEVSAGSSVFIGVQNLEDAEYLSFAIRSGKAHNFVATAQRRTSDGLFLDYSPPDRLQLLNVTNKSVALSDRFPVTAPVMMFVVQNNSTETQTYDAYLYKIGSKVM